MLLGANGGNPEKTPLFNSLNFLWRLRNSAFLVIITRIVESMGKKLDFRLADDCRSVYMRYAGTIAMVYMRGVMDGARLHYAIVSRELPYPPEGQEMLPFDKTTQAGWDFENASPHCLSHLLSPHVQGRVFMKLCAGSPNIVLRLPTGEPQRGAGPEQNYTSGTRRITRTADGESVKSSTKEASSLRTSKVSSVSVPSAASRRST